jgi:hypothetical protein
MTQTAELTQAVRGPYDEFGLAVAIAGTTIVAGAIQADSDAGVAYVFVEPATGWMNMTETADLTASEPTTHFGWSVGVSGKQVVVGSLAYVIGNPVLIYAEPESGWQSTSTPTRVLEEGPASAEFGFSVAISDGVVVAGAPDQTVKGAANQGLAFGFELTPP